MNILFIALHYHGYTRAITDELASLGHNVSVHDIMPRDLAMKALRVLSPGRWQSRIDAHHAAILEAERGKNYDLVLFIQAHQMSATNMAAFKAAFAQAEFALYNWDSISNHDYLPHRAAFDRIATFDPDDARAHGFSYLPLFCVRDFQGLVRREQEQRAIYFVGNVVSPARYDALAAFRAYCETHAIPFHGHLACTPPVQFRLWRSGHRPRGLSLGAIARSEFIAMVETSVAVFDFANHKQSGYTMRIFENLCAGKKIVTDNRRIRHEPFFSPDRIHVFDELDFSGLENFLAVPLDLPDATFDAYRIQSFVKHLVDGTGHPLLPELA